LALDDPTNALVDGLRNDKGITNPSIIQDILNRIYGDLGQPNARPTQASRVVFASVVPNGVLVEEMEEGFIQDSALELLRQSIGDMPGMTDQQLPARTASAKSSVSDEDRIRALKKFVAEQARLRNSKSELKPNDPFATFTKFWDPNQQRQAFGDSPFIPASPKTVQPSVKYRSLFADLAYGLGGISDVLNLPHEYIKDLPIGELGVNTLHNLYTISELGKYGLQAKLLSEEARRAALDEKSPPAARSNCTVFGEVMKDIPETLFRSYVVTLDGATFHQSDSLHAEAERIKTEEPGLYDISNIAGQVATVAVVLILAAEGAGIGGLTLLSTGDVLFVTATGVSIRGIRQDGSLTTQYLRRVAAPTAGRPAGYTRMQDHIPHLDNPATAATTRLTPEQVFALQENLQAITTRSVPVARSLIEGGKPAATVERSLQGQLNLPRFRFIDQVPGGRAAIDAILREFPNLRFPH